MKSTIPIQYILNLQILLSFDVQLHFGYCVEMWFFFSLPSSRQSIDTFNITQQKPRYMRVYSPQRERERGQVDGESSKKTAIHGRHGPNIDHISIS
ncbi:hypothetical protein EYC80_003772 [Monilinia laxa]|uniref:Uncharacterized protein n=1 Tax=Monilinia laxa TaxID=61186 RepID=A0A5N6KKZ9_MONLA|nr:hypothetical protein EYC80_003772 [Monilinia laxa]